MRWQLSAIAVLCVTVGASSAEAQVFTRTQAPADPAAPGEEPASKRVLRDGVTCSADALKPRVIVELIKEEADLLAGLAETGQAAALMAARASVSRAALALSVADRPALWYAAVVRAQAATDALVTASRSVSLGGGAARETARADVLARLDCAQQGLRAKYEKGPVDFPGGSTRSESLLPQAGLAVNDDTRELSLRAAEFYFSNHWRLYLHTTLLIEDNAEEQAAEPGAGDGGDEGEEGDAPAEPAAPSPNDVATSIKSALLNPFGGGLYLAAGYHRKLPTPFLNGDANDLEHGLFMDARAGLKIIELPDQGVLLAGESSRTVFYTGSATLRGLLPVYREHTRVNHEGGVEVALTATFSRVSDPSASSLFADGLVPETIKGLYLAVGISLPRYANISIAGTLASNSSFDKRFVLTFNIQR